MVGSRTDDLAALGLELLQAHVGDVHDRRGLGDARLPLRGIELHRVEVGIAGVTADPSAIAIIPPNSRGPWRFRELAGHASQLP